MDISVNVGMDDIDSPRGGCTTHFASLMVERLETMGVQWEDYPNLIRLNPNIPFRTRGNGAVALRFRTDTHTLDEIAGTITDSIRAYVEPGYSNTNPGMVIVSGEIPESVRMLSEMAVWRLVPASLVPRVIGGHGLRHYEQGNGRGLVGALAAIGNELRGDHTYEYLAYRSIADGHRSRGVDWESVVKMDRRTQGVTFSNIDYESGGILIEPHGPDPVIFGIRGETPDAVKEAAEDIKTSTRIERWMIMRTNQGTGDHLSHQVAISNLRAYMAVAVEGTVHSSPRIIEGGHVLIGITDESGSVDCAAYEPTGSFRETVRKLVVGDRVRAFGGVRPACSTHGLTLNLEGLEVCSLVDRLRYRSPRCPQCGRTMKSAGDQKGFKCPKCGFRDRTGMKEAARVETDLTEGMHLPPPRAQRHLTRPEPRKDTMNIGCPARLIAGWHSP